MQSERSSESRGRVRVERGIYRQTDCRYAVCVMIDGRPSLRTVAGNLEQARVERELLREAAHNGLLTLWPRLTFGAVACQWLARFERRVSETSSDRPADGGLSGLPRAAPLEGDGSPADLLRRGVPRPSAEAPGRSYGRPTSGATEATRAARHTFAASSSGVSPSGAPGSGYSGGGGSCARRSGGIHPGDKNSKRSSIILAAPAYSRSTNRWTSAFFPSSGVLSTAS